MLYVWSEASGSPGFRAKPTLHDSPMSKRKTILVTGGAGFIGSHLCERLLAGRHDVICADNFFTGSKENIRGLLKHDHFELVRHDIVNPIYLEVDHIYNL